MEITQDKIPTRERIDFPKRVFPSTRQRIIPGIRADYFWIEVRGSNNITD